MPRYILSLLLICLFTISISAQSEAVSAFGTVYFYRVEEINALDSRKVPVKVEKKKLLDMPEEYFVGFRVPPGKYGLQMRQKRTGFLLSVVAGKSYFVRVSQVLAGFGFNQSLTLMPEEQAIYQMRDMKALADKNIKLQIWEILREKPVSP